MAPPRRVGRLCLCRDISRYLGFGRASEPALSGIIKLGSQKESLDRGCRDISGVIGPLAEGAEVSDDGRIADDESRMLVSRFSTPFTPCTNAGITWKKSHFVPLFGACGVPSTRDGSLRKPFDRE